jgi:SOS-response transcriptional repressor LexA
MAGTWQGASEMKRYNPKLSTRQRVVRCIQSFWATYHYPPTVREIAAALDLNSIEAVRYHLRALRAAGTLEWQEGNARTIRFVP